MSKKTENPGSRLWKRTWLLAGLFLMTLCSIIPVYAQQAKTVTGTVVDAKGEAITGATVVVKGTTVATL
jgi:hypothetical protein